MIPVDPAVYFDYTTVSLNCQFLSVAKNCLQKMNFKGQKENSRLIRPYQSTVPSLVGTIGIEPMTSCMSSMRSNQLSYAPVPDYFITTFCKMQ